MKNIRIASVIVIALFYSQAFAQGGFSDFIRYKDDLEDSKKLLEGYISPFMRTSTLSLTSGWYNTAKTHKVVGFDITASVSALSIPDKDLFYNINNLGLKNFKLADQNDANPSPDYPNAPTVVGPGREPKYIYTGHGQYEEFDGPGGVDLDKNLKVQKLPMAVYSIGFSLPKGTDLKIRWVPNINVGKRGEFKFWGLGVMHDIKQYFPGIKLMPFDLAAFVGHTQMEFRYDEPSNTIPGENQHAEMKMMATTIQAIISKKFSVLTLYGAAGYNIAKSNIGIKGTYEVGDGNGGTDTLVDPVDMKFNASCARLTGGFRLLLGVITFHADYTLQKYNCINAGLGISVH